MQVTEDLFSLIVEPLRLEGAFVSAWRAGGEWSFAGSRESCALFHYVEEGTLAVDIGYPNAIPLNQGDLAIFPHGGAHRIGNSASTLSVALDQILPSRSIGKFVRVEMPGADGSSLFLCAGLHCGGHAFTPLYRLLPESSGTSVSRAHRCNCRHVEIGIQPCLPSGDWMRPRPVPLERESRGRRDAPGDNKVQQRGDCTPGRL